MTVTDLLHLIVSTTVLGPGVLSPASPGVLEAVEFTRVRHGYGVDSIAGPEVVKLAIENCDLIGYRGWVIVEGVGAMPCAIVDCQTPGHEPLSALGILADVNQERLGHRRAYLVLWDHEHDQENQRETRPH